MRAVDRLHSHVLDAGPGDEDGEANVLQPLEPRDVARLDFPSRDDQHGILQSPLIEQLQRRKQVVLHAWQEGVGRPVEDLDRRRIGPEGPMAGQEIDRLAIADHQVWLLHREVLKEMANAITAVERAADNMIEAQAGFPVLDHVPERVRKVYWGCS